MVIKKIMDYDELATDLINRYRLIYGVDSLAEAMENINFGCDSDVYDDFFELRGAADFPAELSDDTQRGWLHDEYKGITWSIQRDRQKLKDALERCAACDDWMV